MKHLILSSILLLVAGCTTTPEGKKVPDYAAIQMYAQIACALTPSVEQIAAVYTTNNALDKPEKTAAILCAAITAVPQVVPDK